MVVQLRVMSWNIQKRTNTGAYIAELMRLHQIDIAALLEMPTGTVAATLNTIVARLNNLPVAYHQGEWLSQAVSVGDESVGYVWHQNNAVTGNAFQVDIKTTGGRRVFGAVTRNAAGAPIYFPETGTNWAGLPGAPNGRRPSYLSFVTNDGAPARRFTVLDLHTPFNTSTSIQSYATSLLATSREINQVDRTDLTAIAVAAGLGLSAAMAATVDAIINAMGAHNYVVAQTLRDQAVAGAQAAIDGTETNLQTLVRAAGAAGARSAASSFAVPNDISTGDAQKLARAVGVAAAGAAATLVASAGLPTAPPAATAGAANARNAAMTAAGLVVSQLQLPLKRNRSASQQQSAVLNEALRTASVALAPFTFNALPLTAVTASIVAGDFNVRYPDNIVYKAAQKLSMGAANANAYTRLLALGAATNTERSTRIGPTAFRGQLVYTLAAPCPVQWGNNAQPNFVPLNLQALVANPTSFMNWTSWSTRMASMAKAQNVVWAQLKKTYGNRINDAFDKETNNDARFYRANVYDNIFVRGGAITANHGVIDVISELGSWGAGAGAFANPQPAIVPNPWGAAAGGLNALAQTDMATLPLIYTYNGVPYTITAALAEGIEAAVFFDKYLSDHLPVFVEVQV